jgi:hypothetical protein
MNKAKYNVILIFSKDIEIPEISLRFFKIEIISSSNV